jgi:NADH-quinone oxidoreductase subunit E
VAWGEYAEVAMSSDADMDFDAPAMSEPREAGADLRYDMPSESEAARPPAVPPPERPDDFRKIKGIGPAFERHLNELGIYRYVQIANWTAAEQRWIGQHFGFAGRIERDDWVGQAAALAPRSEAATDADPAPGS